MTRFLLLSLFSFFALLMLPSTELYAETPGADAIVKIYTIRNAPNYLNPWAMQGPQRSTGSGCVVSGKRILTNAHVVRDQTYIQVRRYGSPKKYRARVLMVSHDADLATLTVDEPDFFKGIKPLQVGALPKTQQEVVVYGFPLGGDTLSTTKGVVSRIEHQTYAHSSIRLLAAQIDAAINPGNSGGPVLVGRQIVGVVMQSNRWADGIGYMVPAPVVEHFLKDIKDEHYDGFPGLGMVFQPLENKDLKNYAGLKEAETGVLVTHIIPGSPADGHVAVGDVLNAVDGSVIGDDGTIEFRKNERTDFTYAIQKHQLGEKVNLRVKRAGAFQDVSFPLTMDVHKLRLIPTERYDVLPRYFIYGGVVLVPVSKNLLKSLGGKWQSVAPQRILGLLSKNYPKKIGEELVVVLKSLSADVNEGYYGFKWWVVDNVNGVKIDNLKHLVETIENQKENPYVVFKDEYGTSVVLDRAKAEAANEEILSLYRIPADRSAEL